MSPLAYSASYLIWITTLPGVVDTSVARFELRPESVIRQAQTPTPGTEGPPPAPTAPPSMSAEATDREIFLSWGYNGDSYADSNLHISQPSLGNDFTLVDVRVRDSKAWTDLFNHSLTVPQYNVRIGVFLNEQWPC